MQIIFVTPEAMPFSRAGGLADVSFYLPRSLAGLGHQVTVVSPKHRGAEALKLEELPSWRAEIDLSLSRREARFYQFEVGPGHDAVLVGCDDLFDRPGVYGNEFGDYDDNAERFVFFSRAALLAAGRLARPEREVVVHCHDWTAGLVPMGLKIWRGSYPNLARSGTVFTYHNLANQGLFLHYDFALTGLDWNLFTSDGLEFHGRLNLTKAGLLGADLITTVSRQYALETLTPILGLGLEGVLKTLQDRIIAVPNGVDYVQWDPAADARLVAGYSRDDLAGKEKCRLDLAEIFGFTDSRRPMISMVCRLLPRKGLDILVKALDRLMEMPVNLALMGLGETRYQDYLAEAAERYPGRLSYKRAYDQGLLHNIMAGSDIFIMPSRFEPGGLEQLYALRYGAVPVVRGTGGLDDTVVDVAANPRTGTGYKFHEYSAEAFLAALAAAVRDYGDKELWAGLIRRGMEVNYSWDIAASLYEAVYSRALAAAGKRD